MAGTNAKQKIEMDEAGEITATLDGAVFKITPDSKVTAYTEANVEPKVALGAATEGVVSIGKDFAVSAYGAKIVPTATGYTVYADSITLRHANENKTSTAIAAAQTAMKIGDVAADGWYCTDDRKESSPVEMSPPVIMTWEQAAYLSWKQDAQKVFLDEVLGDSNFSRNQKEFRLPGNSAAAKEFNKLSDGKWDKFATVNDEAFTAGRDKSSLISLADDATLKQMFSALSENPKMRAAIDAGKVQDLDRSASYPAGRVWGAAHDSSGARVLYSDGGLQNYYTRSRLAEARFARRGLARS